jgi:hypothetical protein
MREAEDVLVAQEIISISKKLTLESLLSSTVFADIAAYKIRHLIFSGHVIL